MDCWHSGRCWHLLVLCRRALDLNSFGPRRLYLCCRQSWKLVRFQGGTWYWLVTFAILPGAVPSLTRHAPLESWRSEGEDFLQQCAAAGGEVAVAASKLKSLLEEAALQYLQTALDERSPQLLSRLHTSIAASWARSGPRSWLVPHVHAKVALAGSFYLDCGGPLQEDDPAELCGVYLQDPRTPAGMAEVLESLRQKLGWGEAHHVRVRSGSLLLYPAWLQHAGLPPSLNSSSKEEAVSSVSFTVVVQLRESAERSPGQRSTSHQQEL
ncbi:unnamed protein product [Effrenium voratum]|uniref:Uncharacterized protein n=1 Tax=Effrenium voratum TaxID=2562239 RepID=A0AA36HWP2_9DINO|nr:unnamed protein product [Effrenium voratum]CAJ1376745.1 unnamed protein product [Effrenium voratum]